MSEVTPAELHRALAVAARLHARGITGALPIFERLEAELEKAERRESASARAMRLAERSRGGGPDVRAMPNP